MTKLTVAFRSFANAPKKGRSSSSSSTGLLVTKLDRLSPWCQCRALLSYFKCIRTQNLQFGNTVLSTRAKESFADPSAHPPVNFTFIFNVVAVDISHSLCQTLHPWSLTSEQQNAVRMIHCRTPTLQHSFFSSASRSTDASKTSYGDYHSVPKPF